MLALLLDLPIESAQEIADSAGIKDFTHLTLSCRHLYDFFLCPLDFYLA